jgi:hypothetical protein
MSEKRGWGKAVIGWFVVQDEHGGTSDASREPSVADHDLSADELIAKYATDDVPPAPPAPVVLQGPLPSVVNGSVDFDQVYESAGVDTDERDRVTKARDLLQSLPAETPEATKKQIVEASLKAFGVATERIIEAAVAEMEALEAFIRTGQAQTQDTLGQSSRRIGELDAEIQRLRQAMEIAMQEQTQRTAAANAQKLEVQKVLEFFGQEAVARVVRESPKLHEPPAEG